MNRRPLRPEKQAWPDRLEPARPVPLRASVQLLVEWRTSPSSLAPQTGPDSRGSQVRVPRSRFGARRSARAGNGERRPRSDLGLRDLVVAELARVANVFA